MIQWELSVTQIGRERSVIKVAWVDETGEPDEFTGYVDDYLRNRMNRVGASDGVRGSHVFGQVARVYSRGKRRHGNGSKKAQIFV